MFLEKLIIVAERFSHSDVNWQIIINFSNHEAKDLKSLFSLNSREFYETLMIACLGIVFLYFKVPTKTITCFSVYTIEDDFACSNVISVYYR